MFLDSHCHPDLDAYDADRDAMLERARAADVGALLAIGIGAAPGTLGEGLRIARAFDPRARWIYATTGVHPHDARTAVAASFAEIEALSADPRIVAIGEIGLDYHYDHSPRELQQAVLHRQLEIANRAGLPVSIHCRDAWDDCIAALRALRPTAGAVFHCFSGTRAQAEEALAEGFYLSFSGILTFPKAAELRSVAAAAPADRILTETDAPYLAPVPNRGQRNEPAWVALVTAQLAELRGWSVANTCAQVEANFRRLFPRTQ